MNPNELFERLEMASANARKRIQRNQAQRVIAFLRFVVADMTDKRQLRQRFHRNTIRHYREHLITAGISPIDDFEALYWLYCQLDPSCEIDRSNALAAWSRLLWVVNSDRHRTVTHAQTAVLRMIDDFDQRLAKSGERPCSAEGRAA